MDEFLDKFWILSTRKSQWLTLVASSRRQKQPQLLKRDKIWLFSSESKALVVLSSANTVCTTSTNDAKQNNHPSYITTSATSYYRLKLFAMTWAIMSTRPTIVASVLGKALPEGKDMQYMTTMEVDKEDLEIKSPSTHSSLFTRCYHIHITVGKFLAAIASVSPRTHRYIRCTNIPCHQNTREPKKQTSNYFINKQRYKIIQYRKKTPYYAANTLLTHGIWASKTF